LVSINLYTPRSSRGNHKKREKEMNEKWGAKDDVDWKTWNKKNMFWLIAA
jgi:hypothetical protein